MGITTQAARNPRAFVFGLGVGGLLIGTGFLLALLATAHTSAAPGGPSTIYACINLYTGQSRLMLPGQPANCAANEFEVALSSDNPGANLALVQRHHDHHLSGSGSGSAQVGCLGGSRAVGGGVELKNEAGDTILTTDLIINSNSPIGDPANGWRASYDWSAALAGYIARVTVICIA